MNINVKVLILNKRWEVVDIISAKESFRLMSKGNAMALETLNGTYTPYSLSAWLDIDHSDYYKQVNTAMVAVPVPEIIILSYYDDIPEHTVTFNKENLLIRDKYKCAYCGIGIDRDDCTVDHIIPQSKGGVTSWQNCILACKQCNQEKADNMPSGRFKLNHKPKKPSKKNITFHLINKLDGDAYPESWKNYLFGK